LEHSGNRKLLAHEIEEAFHRIKSEDAKQLEETAYN
jgi:hypothetical protein